jgi:hypothetical protein
MAVEQHQCSKAGWQGKEAELPKKILLKTYLKTKPKAYLKQT